MTRIGVITFPGSLDDRDAQRAIRLVGAEAVPLWHGDHDLLAVDAIVLPGGFSYGDYLRAGAIASHAPIMAEVIDAAAKGVPVLGICNGFQMLAEARLVPGAHTRNAHQQFIRRDQRLRVENATTAWTNQFETGEEIVIPLKNADGRFIADAATISRIEGNGRQRRRADAASGARHRGGLRPRHGARNEQRNRWAQILHERAPVTAQRVRTALVGSLGPPIRG
jgi:phosphoribosylformylglycinamidine synthase I